MILKSWTQHGNNNMLIFEPVISMLLMLEHHGGKVWIPTIFLKYLVWF